MYDNQRIDERQQMAEVIEDQRFSWCALQRKITHTDINHDLILRTIRAKMERSWSTHIILFSPLDFTMFPRLYRTLVPLTFCSLVACTGTTDMSPDDDMDSASSSQDQGRTQDMGPTTSPDMHTTQDMGGVVAEDMNLMPPTDMGGTGEIDMDQQDMNQPEDMGMDMSEEEEPWPMYSGTACDVDGAQGVCLPTSRCPGRSVAGHCPGPADMQCCLQGCQTADQSNGQCAGQGMCDDWTTSSMCAGPAGDVGCCKLPEGQGTPISSLWNTYYYLAKEDDYPGTKNTALNSSSCQELVEVSASFSDAVCIEGSGRLSDGRVINYASTCSCGRPCPTGGTVCYSILDPVQFPWGKGARSNPLEPLRSLAVDRSTIALGTTVYLQEWDGYQVPSVDGIGGFTHDGCFRADDVGGAIQGPHIDIFSGTKAMYLRLEQDFPTRTSYTSFKNAPKCLYLNN